MPIFGGGGVSGITSIVFNNGLSGGTITSSGTVGLGTIIPGDVLANLGTVGAVPVGVPLQSGLASSGTGIIAANQSTIAASTTAVVTPSAAANFSAVVNMGSTIATIDVNAGFVGQEITLDIRQNGSTAHAATLGTSFVFGTDITSFVSTNSAVARDLVRGIYLTTTQVAVAAINHGFTI